MKHRKGREPKSQTSENTTSPFRKASIMQRPAFERNDKLEQVTDTSWPLFRTTLSDGLHLRLHLLLRPPLLLRCNTPYLVIMFPLPSHAEFTTYFFASSPNPRRTNDSLRELETPPKPKDVTSVSIPGTTGP